MLINKISTFYNTTLMVNYQKTEANMAKELIYIPFMVSLVSLTSYLPIVIAALTAFIKQKFITPLTVVCIIFHITCMIIWYDYAVCFEVGIVAVGTIFPPIVFAITYFFLKKAQFSKEKFKGKKLFISLLKLAIYALIMSPIVVTSYGFHFVSVDCGI